jgi:hypothetical protein
MAHSKLTEPDNTTEFQLLETMLAGLKGHRPDLQYPESHSDMQACIRAVLTMFEIKRRPLAKPLEYEKDKW